MHVWVNGKVCNMLNFLIEKMMTYASTSLEIKITHNLENINTVKKTKQCDFISPFYVTSQKHSPLFLIVSFRVWFVYTMHKTKMHLQIKNSIQHFIADCTCSFSTVNFLVVHKRCLMSIWFSTNVATVSRATKSSWWRNHAPLSHMSMRHCVGKRVKYERIYEHKFTFKYEYKND